MTMKIVEAVRNPLLEEWAIPGAAESIATIIVLIIVITVVIKFKNWIEQ